MNKTTKAIAKWIKRYNLAAEVRAKEAQIKALTAENNEHFKNIKALNADRLLAEAEVEVYKARLKAVEGLAACYRMQVRPSEKLFSQLDKTSKAIKALEESEVEK